MGLCFFSPAPSTAPTQPFVMFAGVSQVTGENMNFDELPLFRAQDTPTSRAGAQHVRLRLKSQQALLLAVYAQPAAINGITDEEAGERSGLAEQPRCCYWKRCSELRHKGFIRDTGRVQQGTSGSYMMLCEITDAGLAEFGRLRMEEARQ